MNISLAGGNVFKGWSMKYISCDLSLIFVKTFNCIFVNEFYRTCVIAGLQVGVAGVA
jgi:hypothetical protein